jgi:hypothetical protein
MASVSILHETTPVDAGWGFNTLGKYDEQRKDYVDGLWAVDPRTWLVLLKAGRSIDNACRSQEGVGRIAALMIDRTEGSARILGSVHPQVVSLPITRSGNCSCRRYLSRPDSPQRRILTCGLIILVGPGTTITALLACSLRRSGPRVRGG